MADRIILKYLPTPLVTDLHSARGQPHARDSRLAPAGRIQFIQLSSPYPPIRERATFPCSGANKLPEGLTTGNGLCSVVGEPGGLCREQGMQHSSSGGGNSVKNVRMNRHIQTCLHTYAQLVEAARYNRKHVAR